MNIEFNNQKPLILDGGMGQTLIKNGMIPQGTLWSATALLDSSLHQMVIDAHQDFMRAGAKVITTNNFTCLLYTSPSPRDRTRSRMPSSA